MRYARNVIPPPAAGGPSGYARGAVLVDGAWTGWSAVYAVETAAGGHRLRAVPVVGWLVLTDDWKVGLIEVGLEVQAVDDRPSFLGYLNPGARIEAFASLCDHYHRHCADLNQEHRYLHNDRARSWPLARAVEAALPVGEGPP